MSCHVGVDEVLSRKFLLRNFVMMMMGSSRTTHWIELVISRNLSFISVSNMMFICVTHHCRIIPTRMMWNDIHGLLIKLLLLVDYHLVSWARFETTTFCYLLLLAKLLRCQSLISMQLFKCFFMLIIWSLISTCTFPIVL